MRTEMLRSWARVPEGFGQGVSETHLIALRSRGIRVHLDQLLRTGVDREGRIVFLEQGNGHVGLNHILGRHLHEFETCGIPRSWIPDAVMAAVTRGHCVGLQGRPPGRPIFQTEFNGRRISIAVTIHPTGYIVGANPRGDAA